MYSCDSETNQIFSFEKYCQQPETKREIEKMHFFDNNEKNYFDYYNKTRIKVIRYERKRKD
jgi:hypothetical protein